MENAPPPATARTGRRHLGAVARGRTHPQVGAARKSGPRESGPHGPRAATRESPHRALFHVKRPSAIGPIGAHLDNAASRREQIPDRRIAKTKAR
jgi:hypothetical protein